LVEANGTAVQIWRLLFCSFCNVLTQSDVWEANVFTYRQEISEIEIENSLLTRDV